MKVTQRRRGASFPSGMKIPDRKSSGRIDAFTIAGAESAFGIAAVIAKPRAQEARGPDDHHDKEPDERHPSRHVSLVKDPAKRRRQNAHEQQRNEESVEDLGSEVRDRLVAGSRSGSLQDPRRRAGTSRSSPRSCSTR